MSSLVGKPASFFIVPSRKLLGANNILRARDEEGIKVGPVVPNADNNGLLIPLQSGFPETATGLPPAKAGRVVAQERDVLLLGGGSARDAEWVQKPADDAETLWRGVDDPRQMWGFHNAGLSRSCALVYASRFRRLVWANIDQSSDPPTLNVSYRNVDSDVYDTITVNSSIDLGERVPDAITDLHNLRMVELRDGTILAVVRVTFDVSTSGTDRDFDIYHSPDGGLSFTRIAKRVLQKAGASPGIDLSDQFSLAVAGDFIRISFVNNSQVVRSAISSDRGVTWTFAANIDTPTCGTLASTTNPHPHNSVGVDDQGGFLLAFWNGTAVRHASARGTSGWTFLANSAQIPPASPVTMIVQARAMGWIWEWFTWHNTGTGAAGWRIQRRRPEDVFKDFTASPVWEVMEPMSDEPGRTQNPAGGVAVWAGDRFAFIWKERNSGGTELATLQFCYSLGWTQRSIGIARLSDDLNDASDLGSSNAYIPMWRENWYPTRGTPGSPTGSLWALVTAGGGTGLGATDGVTYNTLANTDAAYAQWTFAHAMGRQRNWTRAVRRFMPPVRDSVGTRPEPVVQRCNEYRSVMPICGWQ